MRYATIVLSAAICAAVGCDGKKDEPVVPTAPPASTPPAPQATTPGASTSDPGMPAMPSMPADVSAAQRQATDAAAGATAAAAGATDAAAAQVTTLIDQGMQYVKENKWDMADSTIAKLDGMQDKIPASVKPKYDELKKMYTAAKAGQNMTLPAMPGMSK